MTDREKLIELIGKYIREFTGNDIQCTLADYLIANGVVIREKGEWELTTRSFYRDTFDESCELAVYIVANCSKCRSKHPNAYQVFSKTLYASEDAGEDFRFNQKEEEEKALVEFKQRGYEFADFCPNCGSDMRGGALNG